MKGMNAAALTDFFTFSGNPGDSRVFLRFSPPRVRKKGNVPSVLTFPKE